MDIKNALKTLQWHSKTAKYILSHVIEILDKLDELDKVNPMNYNEEEDFIRQKDNAMVDLYNCLQAFFDYQDEFRDRLSSTNLEDLLTSKLLENDKDSDEVIRRSGEVYAGLLEVCYYPQVWEEKDFFSKTDSLKNGLKDRISSRLMREDELPEFKERMVVSGLNERIISNEPMTLQRANRIAGDWVCYLDLYLSNVVRIQKKVADILDEAYCRMFPKQLPPIFNYFQILRDNVKVRNAFALALEDGLMEVNGTVFRWLKHRQLLAYFCREVSLNLDKDNGEVSWVSFNMMFEARRGKGGDYVMEDNNTLRRCLQDYEDKSRTHKKDTPPDGWELVEDIILQVKK